MIAQAPQYRRLVARANAARLPPREGGPWTSRTTPILSDPDPDADPDAADDGAEAWVAQIWPERAADDVEYASVEYLLPSFCARVCGPGRRRGGFFYGCAEREPRPTTRRRAGG
jgi:hypothetical protein